MKYNRKAYVTYCKDFNGFGEGYKIEIEVSKGKRYFESYYALQNEHFLHWSLLRHFTQLQGQGYEIIFKC